MPYIDVFFHADFVDIPSFNNPIWRECDAIIHCAGTSLVGPSIMSPAMYYVNNVAKTVDLIQWCSENEKHLLFSSSASVYKTRNTPLQETDAKEPLSPYAKSKFMVEQIIGDYAEAYDMKATVFRYFNACGALPGGIHGQDPGATHIFPKLFECNDTFELNGMDFKTRDGTCIRDYIHIQDIATAHILAVEKKCYGVYNLGSGCGYTNLDIINAVNKPYKDVGRRLGDSDCLIADSSYAKSMLGWVPLSTLTDIVNDLKEWYSSDNYKRIKNG
jgi:UDP-glucose 4-epimerase